MPDHDRDREVPPPEENEPGNRRNVRVDDRRHWARQDLEEEPDQPEEGSGERRSSTSPPTLIDEYRGRAEAAERRLQEYIGAMRQYQDEQEQFRTRLNRDVDRRVELRFGEIVSELLEVFDDLDRALTHARDVPEAVPLAEGIDLAQGRFLAALERNGIESIDPQGRPFDPNEAEAVRVDRVSEDLDGIVTETLRPGFRLGTHLVRPARVAVGRAR